MSKAVVRARCCQLVLVACALGASTTWANAQSAGASVTSSSRARADSAARPAWTTTRDWLTLGAFAAGAAIVAPFDSHLATELQRPSLHRSAGVRRTASVIRAAGDPGAMIASVGLYAVGRVAGRSALADAGLHASEAVLLSGAATGVLKGVVGRARPYIVADRDAAVFHPLSSRGGYTAFPSGHTTVAFAAAASLSGEIRRSEWSVAHPHWSSLVGPTMYGTAALVGLSRMYHDAHWASDVVAAAGIGTVTGRILVRAQHRGRRDRVDRWLLPSTIAPTPGGAAIAWRASF